MNRNHIGGGYDDGAKGKHNLLLLMVVVGLIMAIAKGYIELPDSLNFKSSPKVTKKHKEYFTHSTVHGLYSETEAAVNNVLKNRESLSTKFSEIVGPLDGSGAIYTGSIADAENIFKQSIDEIGVELIHIMEEVQDAAKAVNGWTYISELTEIRKKTQNSMIRY